MQFSASFEGSSSMACELGTEYTKNRLSKIRYVIKLFL